MAVDAALINAGAAVGGDIMAQRGAAGTNAMSMQMMYANNAFSARQADVNRKFQTVSANQQRAWSAKEVAQQDLFQEQQADTSMQRRVQDLKRAGLNPALAYQLGGASTPLGATPTSGTPSGSVASASGAPSLQNPNLGFGQLGSQVGSAEQLDSTIRLQDAQANKANAEAGVEIPAQVQYIKSQTALSDTQAALVYKNIQLLQVQLEPANTSDASMAAALQKFRVQIASQDAAVQQGTMSMLIKLRNSEAAADKVTADNIKNASDGLFGKVMAVFHVGAPVAQTAKDAAQIAASVPFD